MTVARDAPTLGSGVLGPPQRLGESHLCVCEHHVSLMNAFPRLDNPAAE